MSLSVHFRPAMQETLAQPGNKLRLVAFIGAIFASVFVVTLPATIPTIVIAYKKLKADYKQHVAEHTAKSVDIRAATVVEPVINPKVEPVVEPKTDPELDHFTPPFMEAVKRVKNGRTVISGTLEDYSAEIKTDDHQRQSLELTNNLWSSSIKQSIVRTKLQIRVPAKFIEGTWDALSHSLATYRYLPMKASIDIPTSPIQENEDVLISIHLYPNADKTVSASTMANLTVRRLQERQIPIISREIPGEYKATPNISMAHIGFPQTKIGHKELEEVKEHDYEFRISSLILDQ